MSYCLKVLRKVPGSLALGECLLNQSIMNKINLLLGTRGSVSGKKPQVVFSDTWQESPAAPSAHVEMCSFFSNGFISWILGLLQSLCTHDGVFPPNVGLGLLGGSREVVNLPRPFFRWHL